MDGTDPLQTLSTRLEAFEPDSALGITWEDGCCTSLLSGGSKSGSVPQTYKLLAPKDAAMLGGCCHQTSTAYAELLYDYITQKEILDDEKDFGRKY